MKKLLFVLIFLFSFILLSPKEFLYKQGVYFLESKGISVQEKKIEEKYFSLHVKEMDVKILKAQDMEAKFFGIYNVFYFTKPASNFMSLSMKEARLTHHIFDPLYLNIWILLQEGELVGKYSIDKKSVKLIYKPKDKNIPNFIKSTFANNQGEYNYEFTF